MRILDGAGKVACILQHTVDVTELHRHEQDARDTDDGVSLRSEAGVRCRRAAASRRPWARCSACKHRCFAWADPDRFRTRRAPHVDEGIAKVYKAFMSSPQPVLLEAPVDALDHVRGSREADITIVEYGDFECHFCQRGHVVLKQLQALFPDALRLVFRHNPRSHTHPNAQRAAEASEAANAQGKFWEMHDRLFEHPEALTEPDLLGHADALGLDAARFTEDLRSQKHASRVSALAATGVHTVLSTPTLFLDGVRYDDALDLDTLELAIGDALRTARGAPRSVHTESASGRFGQRITVGPHTMLADQPVSLEGADAGPDPQDYLSAALATCTAMTLQEAAHRRGWPLRSISVDVNREKREGRVELHRFITLVGDLTDTQRETLLRVSARSPVTRALSQGMKIESVLTAR